ncbi:MAG: ISAs1 family transposase [Firmicutes bacterium]|nr:ISAs1 family transposase [Bacillota bacterium]
MIEILKMIEIIKDPRQQSKIKHKLLDIVIIVLFAKLANADDWEEIEYCAKVNEDFLKKYIELENGVPSHDTIQRVMGMIDPAYMQKIYEKWNELVNSNEGEKLKKIICIDGKTMRGNRTETQKPNHIVSAWSDADGFCLGQKAVDEKSNEITAIPELLKTINVKGCVITIDAMGTQTDIAEAIKGKHADYTLAVKENQHNLYTEISEYFEDKEFLEEIKNNGGYKITQEKAHSSWEVREYYQCSNIKWMHEKRRWKGIKSIGMVCKKVTKGENTTIEKRYYISSFADDIELFARSVREHWSVEVMHWHLDVTFKEDANTTKDKIAAQNLNIINKWCLSILKLLEVGRKKMSLRKKRYCISLDTPKYFKAIMEL